MVAQNFILKDGVTTHQVNAAVKSAAQHYIGIWQGRGQLGRDFYFTQNLDRSRGERRYVYGLTSSLRDTLIGHYIVGSETIYLVFPNHYEGWSRASSYDQMRVAIRDRIVFESRIVDFHRTMSGFVSRDQLLGRRA